MKEIRLIKYFLWGHFLLVNRGNLVKEKDKYAADIASFCYPDFQLHYFFFHLCEMQLLVLNTTFSRCIKPAVVNVHLAFASCGNYPRCIPAAGHLLIASHNCTAPLLLVPQPASSCLEGEKELTRSQFPEDTRSFFPLWAGWQVWELLRYQDM